MAEGDKQVGQIEVIGEEQTKPKDFNAHTIDHIPEGYKEYAKSVPDLKLDEN